MQGIESVWAIRDGDMMWFMALTLAPDEHDTKVVLRHVEKAFCRAQIGIRGERARLGRPNPGKEARNRISRPTPRFAERAVMFFGQ